MATDGQDFTARIPNVGKFFSALRDGASEKIVGALSSAGLAREISNRLPMPEMGPAVDALIANPGTLFASDARTAAAHISDVLRPFFSDAEETEASRYLKKALQRSALNLTQTAAPGDSEDYRRALYVELGLILNRAILLEPATPYVVAKRNLDTDEVNALWSRVESTEANRLGDVIESICSSPKGKPAHRFTKSISFGPKIDSSSRESLVETVFAQLEDSK